MIAAALGWIGSVGTFVAYLLLMRGRLHSTSIAYAAMNAAGGVLGGAAAVMYHAWPSVGSNFVWAALAVYTVAGELRTRARRLRPVALLRIRPVIDDQPALELAS